jgi:2-succinyl-5-enolpyruvyl-6-hydroxy-3-cyclohexene-1-carboxylate synthase
VNSSTKSATELARLVVAELVGAGVRHVVLCPGSRSAPLAYAVHDLAASTGLLRLHVRHDERVAGFTAIGLGRADGRPAAVVTTSGTAVANLHPAVLEAHHGRVPLVVLSADRPARLRGTWANQTSDLQAQIFGAATRFACDLGPADDADRWAAAAREGVAAALGGQRGAGPVHLNLGFDEPLLPTDEDPVWPPRLAAARDSVEGPLPSAGPPAAEPEGDLGFAPAAGTVVVAGDRAGQGARAFAERFDLPLLAEPTSGARAGSNAVGPYRLLLDRPDLGGAVDRAVVFGRPTLSRPVTRLLARPDVEVVVVAAHPDDPGPDRTDVRRVSLAQVLAARSGAAEPGVEQRAWLSAWLTAGRTAAQAVDAVIDGWPVLTGPLVARVVAAATGPSEPLVLAASNPVRDLDLAGRPWGWPPGRGLVHANRGLSGIDGTVSTALGIALGTGLPTRALVGDLALLHDLGALVLGPQEQEPDLTVVVVNDRGGGIFSLLEPGADGERDLPSLARFERLFGTPHRVDLSAVCAGLGVPVHTAFSAAGLRERLDAPSRGLSVIEVRVDREDLRPLHEAIGRTVQRAVDEVLS